MLAVAKLALLGLALLQTTTAIRTGEARLLRGGGGGGGAVGGGAARPGATNNPFFNPRIPVLTPPTFTDLSTSFSQFSLEGGIDAASAGSVTVDGEVVTMPANIVCQFPANTAVWADMFSGTPNFDPSICCNGCTACPSLVGFRIQLVGNIVGNKHVAGLCYISQDFLYVGQGVIRAINVTTGAITVESQNGASAQTIMLNDPVGRFGKAQVGSPDFRFSVDDQNPTVTSLNGYPMCVPRSGTDAACPKKNRPLFTSPWCRNFGQAGVVAAGLPLPLTGDFVPRPITRTFLSTSQCSAFVMPPVAPYLHSGIPPASPPPAPGTVGTTTADSPDPRQQAPLQPGDYITWLGTVFPSTPGVIWAYAITSNVAIWTFPGTLPAYVQIDAFGVSSGAPTATSVTGISQVNKDTFRMEVVVTDYLTPMDFYMVDISNSVNNLQVPTGPTTFARAPLGSEVNRWLTTNGNTAGVNGPVVGSGINAAPVGGGVTTAFSQAPFDRQRMDANPMQPGYVTSPSRNFRAVYRSLCLPPAEYLSGPPPNPAGNFFTIPGVAPPAINAPIGTVLNFNQNATKRACNERRIVANGIRSGTYTAPVFDFGFAETIVPGDPIVPANMWQMDFLLNGEAGNLAAGGLKPTPW